MRELQSKVAVITGAGAGIGRELAIALGKEGCHLALCDISQEGLQETQRLLEQWDINVSTHRVDVSDLGQVEALTEEVVQEHRQVDILINNAGVASGVNFEDQSLEDFQWVLSVNLLGVVYGCKCFLPLLKKQPEAHIVNTCSILGLIGWPVLSAYSASKFAIRGFSESLWHELREHHINVTMVFPGYTKTNISGATKFSANVEKRKSFQGFKAKSFDGGNSPVRVARRTVSGIKKNKLEVFVGIDTFVVALFKRYMPNMLLKIINFAY